MSILRFVVLASAIALYCTTASADWMSEQRIEAIYRYVVDQQRIENAAIFINILIAAVCGYLAKGEDRSIIGWALIGLLLDVSGIIVFYLVVILDHLRSKRA
ncbi:hypothetical protein [Inquilinus limosus]|uniref:hypothetical protein n=1 Tax=Inquilinus limosus TaxID=171674 RepID=UPI00047AB69E|nr:hypothetical protein [Inquilinus limosus]